MKKTLAALGLALAVVSTNPITSYAQQEQIYGCELMTQQERNGFRAQMRAATSIEAREQIRWEHHLRMLERAKERGITLPDLSPCLGCISDLGMATDRTDFASQAGVAAAAAELC